VGKFDNRKRGLDHKRTIFWWTGFGGEVTKPWEAKNGGMERMAGGGSGEEQTLGGGVLLFPTNEQGYFLAEKTQGLGGGNSGDKGGKGGKKITKESGPGNKEEGVHLTVLGKKFSWGCIVLAKNFNKKKTPATQPQKARCAGKPRKK